MLIHDNGYDPIANKLGKELSSLYNGDVYVVEADFRDWKLLQDMRDIILHEDNACHYTGEELSNYLIRSIHHCASLEPSPEMQEARIVLLSDLDYDFKDMSISINSVFSYIFAPLLKENQRKIIMFGHEHNRLFKLLKQCDVCIWMTELTNKDERGLKQWTRFCPPAHND